MLKRVYIDIEITAHEKLIDLAKAKNMSKKAYLEKMVNDEVAKNAKPKRKAKAKK